MMDGTSLDNIPPTLGPVPRFVDGYTNDEDGIPFENCDRVPYYLCKEQR